MGVSVQLCHLASPRTTTGVLDPHHRPYHHVVPGIGTILSPAASNVGADVVETTGEGQPATDESFSPRLAGFERWWRSCRCGRVLQNGSIHRSVPPNPVPKTAMG